jgi:O-antigen/teichoic acid export membrane protein
MSQYLVSIIAVLLQALTALISIPILTRSMSVEDFGHIALIFMVIGVYSIFDSTRDAVIYEINNNNNTEVVLKSSVTVNIFISILSSILMATLFKLSGWLDNSEIIGIIAINLLFFSSSTRYSYMESCGYVGAVSLIKSFSFFLIYVLFIFLAVNRYEQNLYLMFTPLVYVLAYIFIVKWSNKHGYKVGSGSTETLKILIEKTKKTFIFNLWSGVYYYIDRFLLRWFHGDISLGFYTPAYEVVGKVNILTSVVTRVLYPSMLDSHITNKSDLITSWLYFIIFVQYTFFTCISYFSAELLTLYVGEKYAKYDYLILLFSLGSMMNITGYFGSLIARVNGDFSMQNKIYKDVFFVGVIPSIIIVYLYGVIGAAISFFLFRACDVILLNRAINKYSENLSLTLDIKHFLVFFAILLLSLIASFYEFNLSVFIYMMCLIYFYKKIKINLILKNIFSRGTAT